MIENIHTIIAAAAVKFSFDQLTHLFVLIQKVGSHSEARRCHTVTIMFYLFVSLLVRAGRLKVTA